MNKTLKQYYETKGAIEILQKELDELKLEVVEILKDADGKVNIPGASFSLRNFIIYQHSDQVGGLNDQLKALKKEEIENGVATIKSESSTPVMKILEGKK